MPVMWMVWGGQWNGVLQEYHTLFPFAGAATVEVSVVVPVAFILVLKSQPAEGHIRFFTLSYIRL